MPTKFPLGARCMPTQILMHYSLLTAMRTDYAVRIAVKGEPRQTIFLAPKVINLATKAII